MSGIMTASPVLMIRSVPTGVTEKDLEAWAKGYTFVDRDGHQQHTTCVKSLLLTDRMIGFVQMGSIDEAKHIMDLYISNPDQVCMRRPDGTHLLNLIYSDKQEIRAQPRARNQIPTSETRILLVVLKNLSATIMMDELFWIFSQFGTVEKLSSFTKNLKNQVLVQYASQEQASLAMAYLNGRSITFSSPPQTPNGAPGTGSCQLAIVPSKLPELTFKNQDQKNRDYSQINETLKWQFVQARLSQVDIRSALTQLGQMWQWRIRDFLWGVWVLGEGWLDPQQEAQHQGQIPVNTGGPQRGIPEGRVGDCVHISKITTDKDIEEKLTDVDRTGDFTATMLWKLCGMYGDIVAVKMLFKYEGSAIVQFKSSEYAKACIEYLGSVPLWGAKWDVKQSKNANAMHWSGANTELESRMCTILTDEPPEVPPMYNLAKPCNSLVLWDVPVGVSQGDLVDLFASRGKTMIGTYGRVVDAEIKHGGTASVVMETVEDAVVACAMLNGTQVEVGGYEFILKVHFDKTPRHFDDDDGFPRTVTEAVAKVGQLHGASAGFMARTFTA
eukprot:TRINITY_DN1593_c0_g1_i1.p1 TRINITY_DN1593_c0_g1~~TRINITY_DN1593_c0_g1_i1.p1  ORF type:complete len:571 (+),score=253.64 TRINITY_DN1593_c0_g1_i1:49-1713(+)